MKNEIARREIESLDYYLQNHTNDYSEESHTAMMMAIKALKQEPKSEWEQDHEILKAYSDGANEALDKIEAEISEQSKMHLDGDLYIKMSCCMQIINKYRSESEEK